MNLPPPRSQGRTDTLGGDSSLTRTRPPGRPHADTRVPPAPSRSPLKTQPRPSGGASPTLAGPPGSARVPSQRSFREALSLFVVFLEEEERQRPASRAPTTGAWPEVRPRGRPGTEPATLWLPGRRSVPGAHQPGWHRRSQPQEVSSEHGGLAARGGGAVPRVCSSEPSPLPPNLGVSPWPTERVGPGRAGLGRATRVPRGEAATPGHIGRLFLWKTRVSLTGKAIAAQAGRASRPAGV